MDRKMAHKGNIFMVKQSPITQPKIFGFLNAWVCFRASRMVAAVERNNNYRLIFQRNGLVSPHWGVSWRDSRGGVWGTKLTKGNCKSRRPIKIHLKCVNFTCSIVRTAARDDHFYSSILTNEMFPWFNKSFLSFTNSLQTVHTCKHAFS